MNCCGNCCLSYSFEFFPFRTSLLDNLEGKWTSIPMIFYIRIRTRHCCCNRCLSYLFECVDCGLSSLHILGCKFSSRNFLPWEGFAAATYVYLTYTYLLIAACLLLIFECVRTPRDHWYGSDESGEGIADGIVAFLRVVVFPMSFIFSW